MIIMFNLLDATHEYGKGMKKKIKLILNTN